jgi:hypothetical protein
VQWTTVAGLERLQSRFDDRAPCLSHDGLIAVIPRRAHGMQFAAPDELAGAVRAFIVEAGIA